MENWPKEEAVFAASTLTATGLFRGVSGLSLLLPSSTLARVKVLLSKEVRNRLGKRLDNEALVNVDGLEYCKRCSFAMLIETPVEIDKVFSCDKCKAEFCRLKRFLSSIAFLSETANTTGSLTSANLATK